MVTMFHKISCKNSSYVLFEIIKNSEILIVVNKMMNLVNDKFEIGKKIFLMMSS